MTDQDHAATSPRPSGLRLMSAADVSASVLTGTARADHVARGVPLDATGAVAGVDVVRDRTDEANAPSGPDALTRAEAPIRVARPAPPSDAEVALWFG